MPRPGYRVGYAFGSDAIDEPEFDQSRPISSEGVSDIYRLRTFEPRHYGRVHVTPGHFDQPKRYQLHVFDVVLNLITDPDQSPRSLRTLAKMLDGYSGRVINRPEAVLQSTRDQVANRLADIEGLVVPRAVRIDAGDEAPDLALPVIVRRAGTHTGRTMVRAENADELAEALGDEADHYAIEHVDARSSDGLYRKYRFFCIDGAWFFAHLAVSPRWIVHWYEAAGFMAGRPELVEEERALFKAGRDAFAPATWAVLDQVNARMELDYYGLDCGLDTDGRVILFEANACMNLFPLPEGEQFAQLRTPLEAMQRAFHRMMFDEELPDG